MGGAAEHDQGAVRAFFAEDARPPARLPPPPARQRRHDAKGEKPRSRAQAAGNQSLATVEGPKERADRARISAAPTRRDGGAEGGWGVSKAGEGRSRGGVGRARADSSEATRLPADSPRCPRVPVRGGRPDHGAVEDAQVAPQTRMAKQAPAGYGVWKRDQPRRPGHQLRVMRGSRPQRFRRGRVKQWQLHTSCSNDAGARI